MPLIHFNIGATPGINQGILALCDVVRAEGHEAAPIYVWDENQYAGIIDHLGASEAQIPFLGISYVEPQYQFVHAFLSQLAGKHPTFYAVVGGPGPTMNPERALELPLVTMACVGEGELPLSELLRGVARGGGMNWAVKGYPEPPLYPFVRLGGIRINYQDAPLDFLLEAKHGMLEVALGRGCLGRCSYCINDAYLAKYAQSGIWRRDYIRIRDPDRFVFVLL